MDSASPHGYFGKIPCRGDFLSRGLTPEFTQHWDDWLQRGISSSQTQLGTSWHEIYMTSPIWRFVLSAGTCDSYFWVGLFLPSVDQIGRHYPLMLATRVDHDQFSAPIVDENDPWFSAAENLGLAVLQGSVSAESFDAHIENLPVTRASDPSLQVRFNGVTSAKETNPHWILNASFPGQFADALSFVAQDLILKTYSVYSLWWTPGSLIVAPTMMVSANLPSPSGFASFLDGNWDRDKWNNRFVLPS